MLILLPGTHSLLYLLNQNVNKYLLNRKNKLIPSYFREINSISENYDIIHVHMRYNLRYIWFASFFSEINWNRVFFHDHYGNIKDKKAIDFLTKNIIHKSIYIGVSKELCDWAEQYCGVKKKYLLENIIIKEEVDHKKKQINPANRLVLISNIHPRKNIEFAIVIMNELRKQGIYYLDVIGQKSDVKYYNKVINIIKQFSLEDCIKINENCNNVQSILNNYDLALHTSKSEAGPLVLIEYLAQSLPFITYSTGGVVKKIKNELNLLIINDFDVKKWISRINELLLIDKKDIKQKMDTAYLNNFSSSTYFNKCLKIYQENLS